MSSQEEISESDVDPHFKRLFKQIAGNVGRRTLNVKSSNITINNY